MNAVVIFLLIGVAHWAAHILGCKDCQANIFSLLLFGLEGACKVFGWPVTACSYLVDILWPAPPAPKEKLEAGRLRIERDPGESDEDFQKRISETVGNLLGGKK